MARINYEISPKIHVIPQPSAVTCWAAVGTMMMNWGSKSYKPIAQRMGEAGPKWLKDFKFGVPLMSYDASEFVQACGLRTHPLVNLPAESWLALLRRHGPLAVATMFPNNAGHMRIVYGMSDSPWLHMKLVDPKPEVLYSKQDFTYFVEDYERMVRRPDVECQIWYR